MVKFIAILYSQRVKYCFIYSAGNYLIMYFSLLGMNILKSENGQTFQNFASSPPKKIDLKLVIFALGN